MSAAPQPKQVALNILDSFIDRGNIIAIPKQLILFCEGDVTKALVLSQLLYWDKRTKNPDGWIVKTYQDWTDELGISEYQIRRAIKGDKRSKKSGLDAVGITTKVGRSHFYNGGTATHYKVDRAALLESMYKFFGDKNSTMSSSRTEQCKVPGTEQCQETVQETTTETTASIPADAEAPTSNVFQVYEQHASGTLTPLIADGLKDLETEYTEAQIVEAIKSLAPGWSGVKPIEAQIKKQQQPAPTTPKTKMDPMKDAIASAFGFDWTTMTASTKGQIMVAAKELCDAQFTPEDIPGIYRYCKKRFDHFGPRALSNHASAWKADQVKRSTPPPTITIDETPRAVIVPAPIELGVDYSMRKPEDDENAA